MTSAATSAVFFALFIAGCGGTTLTEVGGPGGVRCQTTLGSPVPAVGSGGGQVVVPVVAARDCIWSAASEASWLQVTPGSGQGESDLTLVVAENQQAQARTGAFLLNDQRFMLSQDAPLRQPPSSRPFPQPPPTSPSTCAYALDDPSNVFDRQGGEGSVGVITNDDCVWAAASTAGWITITSDTSGIGSGEVRYRVTPFGGTQRTGTIVAAGRTHTITQNGRTSD